MSFKNESQESFDESAKDHGFVPFPPPPDEPAVLLHPDEDPDDDPDPVLPDDDCPLPPPPPNMETLPGAQLVGGMFKGEKDEEPIPPPPIPCCS